MNRLTPARATRVRAVGLLVLSASIPALTSVADASVDVRPASAAGATTVRVVVTYPAESLILGTRDGHDTVRLEGLGLVGEAGRPELPVGIVRVALPEGMAATGVRVGAVGLRELPGTYDVPVASGPRPIVGVSLERSESGRDRGVYESPEPYPPERVVLVGQTDLAGQGVAVLRVCPVQYVPTEGRLVLADSIEIILECAPGYECGDYLPGAASDRTRSSYRRMLEGMVANPGAVALRTDPRAGATRTLESGAYECVIITDLGWVDDFQPLADWRTRKGSPAKIVTTMWIYNLGGYEGSNLEKIRAFVIDAHQTWGLGKRSRHQPPLG